MDKQAEPARNITKVDTKIPITVTSSQSPSTPESPSTPTQITLAKAPTPWMQNKNKPQEELPEWAKRTNVNKTIGSDSSENSVSPIYIQVQASPQCSQAKQKQEQKQYSIPQCQQTKPQQLSQQPQQQQPQQQQQRQSINSVTSQQTNSQSHERVVPIRVSW